jgi:subtilisin family serine protease
LRNTAQTRKVHSVVSFVAILLLVLLVGSGDALADSAHQNKRAAYRDGIVLLAFRDGIQQSRQDAVLSSIGAREIKRIGVGVHVVTVRRGRVPKVVQLLRARDDVRFAEPDYLQTLSAGSLPNDTSVGVQWAVQNTGQTVNGTAGTAGADERALAAWGITTGTNSVIIAELDTGVQYSHPDLFTNMWNNPGGLFGCAAGTHGYNVVSYNCDPMDDDTVYSGHGTHVAGIMGAVANNAAGIAGTNWTTSIMAMKWVNSSGTGTNSALIEAMDWVVKAKQAGLNIRVVNDSQTWAGTAFSQAVSDEIDLLGSNDILFVTASGNTAQNNDTTPRYPCSYARPNMICVAASDQKDKLWSSANYGPNTVHLAAPGVNIYSTLRASNFAYVSGGSMASPQVAGTAALILSLGYQSVSNLKSMILNSVDVLPSLSGLVGTGGRLNVCKAVPGCSTAVAAKPAISALPVATSIPQQGGLLGASTGIWTGVPSTYTYQWSRCDPSGLNCALIPGATGQTYAVLAPADVSATLVVTVTAANAFGSTAAQSSPSGVVASATSPSAINSSIVSGTNISGSVNWTVTPSRSEQFVQFYVDGVLTQTDSTSPYSFPGSLNTTTLANGPHVLGARALFTDNRTYDFYGETVTVANPPQNTGLPVISGTMAAGQTISTSTGTWNANTAPTSFSYQWEHCDSSGLNCTVVSGTNGSSYLLSGTDVNFTIRSSVTGSNPGGSATVVSTQTGVVPPPPLAVATSSVPGGMQNNAYSTTLAATGGTAPYTWSIASGTLPTGLALAPSTGVISGTPTGTGTSNFTVRVTDVKSATSTQGLSLNVSVALTVTTTSLPSGTQLAAYSTPLAATGGTTPYTWSLASGTLPSGLSLAPSTGVISGTSTVTGTSNLTVRVTDANSLTATQALSLTINSNASGGGTIGLVQANAVQGSNVSLVSATFPVANTAGNLIIAAVRMSTSSQTVTLSDSAGNTYVEAVAQVQTSDGHQMHVFYARNILGAATNTVTATFSSNNNYPWVAIYEYKGLSPTSPLDQTAHAQGNSATASSGPTPTTTSSNELVFGATAVASIYSGTQAAGSGYVLLENDTATSPAATESMMATATGSYAANFSLASSVPWAAVVATFTTGGVGVTTTSLPSGTQNAAYTATLAATGGATPYAWSIASGTLPAGLSLASSTGVISGTPTGTGTSNFTVLVTDANSATGSQALSLTVTGPLTVTTTSLPGGTQNTAYSTTLAATGGSSPYTWSIASGTLPAGLTLASSTGVISGTPTGTGTTNLTAQVTDANSLTATQALNLTVVAPLTVTTTSLPGGTQNTAYSTTLAATGGTTPYTWSVASGTLPSGLMLASSTGVISGTPTGTGTSKFTVQVTDANSVTANQALSLTVAAPPTVTTTSLPGSTQNTAYSMTLAATGGTTPYAWSISSGSLPSGLALASSTGVISGTPTGTGSSNFTVLVTDSNSVTANQALSLTVAAPLVITTTSLPGGTQNTSYSATLAATGGTTPYAWSVTSGTLPAGLSLVASTGVVSGTPTGTGTSNFTVRVTDTNLVVATQALSLTVIGPPSVITTSLPGGTQNAAYTATLAATSGTTPYAWSISSGTLPVGLSLASSTGVISGTPTSTSTSNFTVLVTDANSMTATKTLSVTVAGPPTVTTTSLPGGTQNAAYTATLAATSGTTPYTWSISSGTLPAGLSLASSTGVISGTPTSTGTSNFTVLVTDANSATANQALSLTVVAALTVTTTSLTVGEQNVAYSATLSATGGTVPYTWSISSGALPAGLSVASSTGVISGTPSGSGTSNLTVGVTDANLVTATKALSLTVVPPPSVTTASLPNGAQTTAYSATLAASGGTTPYTWSVTSGTLPVGLALASSTGVISGTPTTTGTSNFTVQVTDANSVGATKALSLTIGSGGIGLVQANAAQGTAVGSLSVAFPVSNTTGNLILAFVRMSSATQTVTLADAASNAYIEAVAQVQNSDGSQIHLFYARNILGRVNTVTATFSATNNHPWLAIYEYKGLSTTNPLDQTAHGQGNVSNAGVATPTTTSANELIFAGLGFPSSYTGAQMAGSGFTLVQNDTATSPAATESMLVTATGSYNATFSLSSSVNVSEVVATFK